MKKTILSLFLFLLLPLPVGAATITVCSSGCSYSDVQSAYNVANAGDVVEIRDNRNYAYASGGGITMSRAGTQSAPITLQAGSGFSPTFERTSGSTPLFYITGSWNVLKGINITGTYDGEGIRVSANNVTIDGCRLNNIQYRDLAVGTGADGIMLNGTSNCTVKNNTILDVNHAGIMLYGANANNFGNKILNNTINNRYGTGIIVGFPGTSYTLIEGNDIKIGGLSNYHGKCAIQITGSSHNTIRRNVIHDTYYKAIQVTAYTTLGSTVASHNWFYNNTLFNVGHGTAGLSDSGFVGVIFGAAGGGNDVTMEQNKFYNNIFARTSSGNINAETGVPAGSPGPTFLWWNVTEQDAGDSLAQVVANDWKGNHLKNNCIRPYYGGAYHPEYAHTFYYSNATGAYNQTWSAAAINGLGSMSGNITSDPLFVSESDTVANWWNLRSGSPMIDAGIAINDPNAATGGWSQMTYSGARPDIGAYESGASGGTATAPAAPKNLRIIAN